MEQTDCHFFYNPAKMQGLQAGVMLLTRSATGACRDCGPERVQAIMRRCGPLHSCNPLMSFFLLAR